MILYLMRHGEAENHALSDASRELTPRGIAETRAVSAQLQISAPAIERAITSPFQRALQTSSILSAALAIPPFEVSNGLQPEADLHGLMDVIEQTESEHLLLVAHNPLLSNLLGLLVDGNLEKSRYMGTSHMACISLTLAAPGCGELLYTLTPST